jgi:hypothetical protein
VDLLGRWDAVADDVIQGNAGGIWKTIVAFAGRDCIVSQDFIMAYQIKLQSCNSGHYKWRDMVENVGCQRAGSSESDKIFAGINSARLVHNDFLRMILLLSVLI